eukprot:2549354-Prymnesium_polylepis.1
MGAPWPHATHVALVAGRCVPRRPGPRSRGGERGLLADLLSCRATCPLRGSPCRGSASEHRHHAPPPRASESVYNPYCDG